MVHVDSNLIVGEIDLVRLYNYEHHDDHSNWLGMVQQTVLLQSIHNKVVGSVKDATIVIQ